jgi:hypothetical protein
LFVVLTDEERDGNCIVEFPSPESGRPGWRISLMDLRSILDRAEGLMMKGK